MVEDQGTFEIHTPQSRDDRDLDALDVVNRAAKEGRTVLAPHVETCRAAINRFNNRADEDTDTGGLNVVINRLISDIEATSSRDDEVLLSEEPFFPLQSKNPKQKRRAQLQESMVNGLLRDSGNELGEGGFYVAQSTVNRMMRAHGLVYMEPRWDVGITGVLRKEPEFDAVLGTVVGFNHETSTEVVEGPEFIPRALWEVYRPSLGNSLHRCSWTAIKELVDYREIEKMIDLDAGWSLPDGVDMDEVRKSTPTNSGDGNWEEELRRDRAALSADGREGVGTLFRYFENPSRAYPRGRWIYALNYSYILFIDESPLINMRPTQKPLIAFRNVINIGPDRWKGIGLYELTQDASELQNMFASLYMEDVLRRLGLWVAYDPERVNIEQLEPVIGQRTAVKGGIDDSALKEIELSGASKESFDAMQFMADVGDNRTYIHSYQRGETPSKQGTATRDTILAGAGDTVLGAQSRRTEMGPYAELALYVYKMCDANMTAGQLYAYLPPEDVLELVSLDPEHLDGGYRWNFSGSTMVKKRAREDEKFMESYNMHANDQSNAAPWILKRKHVIRFTPGLTEDEASQMYPDPNEQDLEEGGGVPPVAPEPVVPLSEAPQSGGGTIVPPQEIATPAGAVEAGVAA